MKTTLELPDELLIEAKALAARRKTTLKALVTHALRREIRGPEPAPHTLFKIDNDGLPHLPRRGVTVTNELVNQLLEEDDS